MKKLFKNFANKILLNEFLNYLLGVYMKRISSILVVFVIFDL